MEGQRRGLARTSARATGATRLATSLPIALPSKTASPVPRAQPREQPAVSSTATCPRRLTTQPCFGTSSAISVGLTASFGSWSVLTAIVGWITCCQMSPRCSSPSVRALGACVGVRVGRGLWLEDGENEQDAKPDDCLPAPSMMGVGGWPLEVTSYPSSTI